VHIRGKGKELRFFVGYEEQVKPSMKKKRRRPNVEAGGVRQGSNRLCRKKKKGKLYESPSIEKKKQWTKQEGKNDRTMQEKGRIRSLHIGGKGVPSVTHHPGDGKKEANNQDMVSEKNFRASLEQKWKKRKRDNRPKTLRQQRSCWPVTGVGENIPKKPPPCKVAKDGGTLQFG